MFVDYLSFNISYVCTLNFHACAVVFLHYIFFWKTKLKINSNSQTSYPYSILHGIYMDMFHCWPFAKWELSEMDKKNNWDVNGSLHQFKLIQTIPYLYLHWSELLQRMFDWRRSQKRIHESHLPVLAWAYYCEKDTLHRWLSPTQLGLHVIPWLHAYAYPASRSSAADAPHGGHPMQLGGSLVGPMKSISEARENFSRI